MTAVVGTRNAGFDIIEAEYTDGTHGYALGRSGTQYVTWWFTNCDNTRISFYHGNYFPIDPDAPGKSAARAQADYHRRLADSFNSMAKYGY